MAELNSFGGEILSIIQPIQLSFPGGFLYCSTLTSEILPTLKSQAPTKKRYSLSRKSKAEAVSKKIPSRYGWVGKLKQLKEQFA